MYLDVFSPMKSSQANRPTRTLRNLLYHMQKTMGSFTEMMTNEDSNSLLL
jgi:hypothetical protein